MMKLNYILIDKNKVSYKQTDNFEIEIIDNLLETHIFKYSLKDNMYLITSQFIDISDDSLNAIASRICKESIYGASIIVKYDPFEDEYHSIFLDDLLEYELEIINEI